VWGISLSAGLASVLAKPRLERAGRDEPFVQPAAAERILEVLVGPGAVAVERDGEGREMRSLDMRPRLAESDGKLVCCR